MQNCLNQTQSNMGTYLFAIQPSNDLGLLAQALPIAHELRNRGHQVIFCTSGKVPCNTISKAGFKNDPPDWPLYLIFTGDVRLRNLFRVPFSGYPQRDLKILSWYRRHIKASATQEIWNIDHFMYIMGMGNVEYTKAVVGSMSRTIVRHKPDAIVTLWNPYMNIAAKIHDLPVISVMQSDVHPASKGFIWWKEPPAALPTPVEAVNQVLSQHHLPSVESVGALSVGDLSLIPGIPETDPLPDANDVHYVGIASLQDCDEKHPEWLNQLPADQPIIWLYPGNLQYIKGHDGPFDGLVILNSCIEVLKTMDVRVVLSTGGHPLPEEGLPLPSNFIHIPFVPGVSMAERCDLMIHHGGFGSSQTGLYTGTPALVIPTFSERESNARKMAALGAGEFLVPSSDASGKGKTIDLHELRSKIEKVLSNDSYGDHAEKIGKKLRNFGGASHAANLILQNL